MKYLGATTLVTSSSCCAEEEDSSTLASSLAADGAAKKRDRASASAPLDLEISNMMVWDDGDGYGVNLRCEMMKWDYEHRWEWILPEWAARQIKHNDLILPRNPQHLSDCTIPL